MPRDPRSCLRLTITPAAVAILLFSAVASAQNPETYVTVVQRYAAGDVSGAIALFADSTPRLSGDIITRMRALPDRLVRAAVTMHTELAAARIRLGEVSPATIHVANAQRLLNILTEDVRRRSASQVFAIRWYAFVTNVWAAQGRFDAAFASVRDGLTAFPGSAELYVARGCVNEMRGSIVALDSRSAFVDSHDRISLDRIRHSEQQEHLVDHMRSQVPQCASPRTRIFSPAGRNLGAEAVPMRLKQIDRA